MTLAICRRIGDQIFLIADTRISEHGVNLSPAEGTVKTTFLSSQVAIAFANSPELAARAIGSFENEFRGKFSMKEATEFFCLSSKETQNDYLMMHSATLAVVKISNGKSYKTSGQQSWIGDYTAFERFREYQAKVRKGPDIWVMHSWQQQGKNNEQGLKFLHDFELTIEDPEIHSVGDFYTIATNTKSGFKFLPVSKMYFDSLGKNPINPWFGENFDYSYSIAAPKCAGINAVAFYYGRARVAYIFYSQTAPGVANKCKILRNVAVAEFVDTCRAAVGIEFDLQAAGHTTF